MPWTNAVVLVASVTIDSTITQTPTNTETISAASSIIANTHSKLAGHTDTPEGTDGDADVPAGTEEGDHRRIACQRRRGALHGTGLDRDDPRNTRAIALY
jgi:hypothetical protein